MKQLLSIFSSSIQKYNAGLGQSGFSKAVMRLSVFVVLILIIDQGFVVFAPLWERFRPARQFKMKIYEEVLQNGPDNFDTVFIGSSTVNMGIDPEVIDKIAGTHSFNAGQAAYTPLNIINEVLTEVIAQIRPRRIIYAIDSWSLNRLPFDRKIVDEGGTKSPHIFSFLNSYRNRSAVLFWIQYSINDHFISPITAWQVQLREAGRIAEYEGFSYHKNGFFETFARLNPDWKFANPPGKARKEIIELFETTVDYALDQNVDLIVLQMPDYSGLLSRFPGEHEKFTQLLHTILDPRGVEIFEYGLPWTFKENELNYFLDLHHLNSAGAKQFSRVVGERLREHINSQ